MVTNSNRISGSDFFYTQLTFYGTINNFALVKQHLIAAAGRFNNKPLFQLSLFSAKSK
jgi:hypothetical protein